MYERRAGFWVAYACLTVLFTAALAAGFYKIAAQDTRTVVRVKDAPPITSVTQARAALRGEKIGADAGLPEGCAGVYMKGGAVIICNQ